MKEGSDGARNKKRKKVLDGTRNKKRKKVLDGTRNKKRKKVRTGPGIRKEFEESSVNKEKETLDWRPELDKV